MTAHSKCLEALDKQFALVTSLIVRNNIFICKYLKLRRFFHDKRKGILIN